LWSPTSKFLLHDTLHDYQLDSVEYTIPMPGWAGDSWAPRFLTNRFVFRESGGNWLQSVHDAI
jgi:hypothetical protein